MTQIYLARHGETEWNAIQRIQGFSNSSLNDLGHRQAKALAERLRRTEIKAIYSSDLSRAMETAAPIASLLNLTIQSMTELRERGYGDWEGMTLGEVAEKFPEEWHKYHKLREIDAPIPGGEVWEDVYLRVVKAVEAVIARHPDNDDTVLIVGHGGSLRVAVLHALAASLSMITHLKLDNAGLSRLDYRGLTHGSVVFLNDTSHLIMLKQ